MSKTIGTILTLKDKMSPKLFKVSDNVKSMSKEMKKAAGQSERMANKFTSGIGKMVAKAGKAAAAFGALAAAATIKVGFDGLKELDEGVAKIKSIGGAAINVDSTKSGLLQASNKTGVAAGDLAEAQYSAISSGVAPDDSLAAAVASAKLARAGFTDADNALKIMTSTMNVYGLSGEEAMTAISDKLLSTQNLGVTTVAELANSMGALTPVANSAGASIDDLMAGMASLTKNGLKTEEATTSLKGIMSSVIKPTKQASDEAARLGIDFSAAAIESKGFAGFLEDVKEKTGGSTESLSKLFGDVRALSGALVLTGSGFEDFNVSLDAMKNSAGATEEAYAVMQNTIGAKLDKLKNIARNTATSIVDTQSGAIGELVDRMSAWVEDNEAKIQGWVQAIGDGITRVVDAFKAVFGFIRDHQDVIIFFASFAAAIVVLTKAIAIAKGVIAALQVVFMVLNGTLAVTPIGWIVVGIAALVAAGVLLYKHWDTVKAKAADLWGSLKTFVSEAVESFQSRFPAITAVIMSVWDGLKSWFDNVKQAFIGMIDFVKNVFAGNWSAAWENVVSIFGNVFGALASIAKIPMNAVISVINSVLGKINSLSITIPDWVPGMGGKTLGFNIPKIPALATGGIVTAPTLAMVGEGREAEAVLPLSKLDAMLSGKKERGGVSIESITINARGVTADEVMREVVPKLRLALANM